MNFDPVRISVDLADLAHLMAGGTILLDSVNVELVPSSEIYRISQRVRTRVNSGRRRLPPLPDEKR
jgi:hypothetical protein